MENYSLSLIYNQWPVGSDAGLFKSGKSIQHDPKNEISPGGIVFAGALLIVFLLFPVLSIISLWPNAVPSDENAAAYEVHFFHTVLTVKSPVAAHTPDTAKLAKDTTKQADSKKIIPPKPPATTNPRVVSLNTLILLLVALGGFFGNMIHIAGSFAAFVGAKEFKKSWTLWYFIKPFTAAGLALALYFALRAGFFSASAGSTQINLYGVMIAAILAGLFTDDATLKLKEVFEVIFKPKDNRPDKITAAPPIVSSVKCEMVTGTTSVKITVGGQNFQAGNLIVLAEGQKLSYTFVSDSQITALYTNTAKKTTLDVKIEDSTAKVISDQHLAIT